MDSQALKIDEALVRSLVAAQFPQWKELPVQPVALSGWDNRTFHLGDQMLVRLPSAQAYAFQVEKEHRWLPKLAPHLPLPIPVPLAMGEPALGYPWKWSVYRWLEGETAATAHIDDLNKFAAGLAGFLHALQKIDPKEGPLPGPENFYRGGEIKVYEPEMLQALALLKNRVDVEAAKRVWKKALATAWRRPPVWIHGDVSAGNLLLQRGELSGVIDFGQVAIGDPACDLSIAWTLFAGESREVFRAKLCLDEGTWMRGRAWTLWKAMIIAAGLVGANAAEAKQCWRIIGEVLDDQN
ncbi:MAG: aminoglycoside phosphotransferase family protein [Parachlamydiales bacterium]|nr:aminoglycoside phosphotransferase family protein [Candidatus Acheromyda pituitae]